MDEIASADEQHPRLDYCEVQNGVVARSKLGAYHLWLSAIHLLTDCQDFSTETLTLDLRQSDYVRTSQATERTSGPSLTRNMGPPS